ncbi:MAG: Ig-like domain-containing protein, partial [bacterium]
YTYTPNANISGNDTLTYKVCDNGTPSLCDTATLIITITPVNDAPVAVNDFVTLSNSITPKAVNVHVNDFDIDGTIDSTTVSIVSTTKFGTAILNSSNGYITYDANDGFVGKDTLVYNVKDNLNAISNNATVIFDVLANSIVATNDNLTSISINGAKGDTIGNILTNDSLLSNVVSSNEINISLVDSDGITGLLILSNGEIVIPQGTFEGTYEITYQICEKNNPLNCDQATVTFNVSRGLVITTQSICRNDVPYLSYNIAPNFTPSSNNQVTITWLNGDGTSLNPPVVYNNLTQSGEILWPGAVLDNQGNPIDWPGWIISNGQWIQAADGFENTRPNSLIRVSINPTDSILVSYPPATPNCNSVPFNRAPVANNDVDTIDCNQSLNINVVDNDTDFENGVLNVSLLNNTSIKGASLQLDNNSIIYTPTGSISGFDTFLYVITDVVGLKDTAEVSIYVNCKPVAVDDQIATNEDQAISNTVANNDSDPNNDLLQYSKITDPKNGSITFNSDGTFTYIPQLNFNGNDTILYKVCEVTSSALCDTAKLIIIVNPINDAPTAINDNETILVNTSATVDASLNDSDIDGDNLLYVFELPINGSITVQNNSEVTYTPNNNFTGQDSLRYIVCDDGNPSLCDTAYIVITIDGNPNQAPIAIVDSFMLAENNTLSKSVAVNDIEPDSEIMSFRNLTSTVNGQLEFNADGSFVYTPNAEFIGIDSFRYAVCDNNVLSMCDTATCIITVVNTPLPRVGLSLEAKEPEAITEDEYLVTLIARVKNFGDADLENVRVIQNLGNVFSSPAEFSITSITATNGLKANANYNGVDDLELLDSTQSIMNIDNEGLITMVIRVKPNLPVSEFFVQAVVFAKMAIGDTIVTDISHAGNNPDPNGDSNPTENEPTKITITLFIPSGFSPDGDGVNDGFVIKGLEKYPQNKIEIFNRWGNKVYEKAPYDNSWSGTSRTNGVVVLGDGVLPNGTYYYILDFGVPGVAPQTGYVVIKK